MYIRVSFKQEIWACLFCYPLQPAMAAMSVRDGQRLQRPMVWHAAAMLLLEWLLELPFWEKHYKERTTDMHTQAPMNIRTSNHAWFGAAIWHHILPMGLHMKFDEKGHNLIEYNKHNIWICCHTLDALDHTLIGYLVYWLNMLEINITVWLYSGIFLND